jgi:hypothetical protein
MITIFLARLAAKAIKRPAPAEGLATGLPKGTAKGVGLIDKQSSLALVEGYRG